MIKVIGLEGTWPASAMVAWGAAVVTDGTKAWNSFTGFSVPLELLSAAGTRDIVTEFPAVDIRPEHDGSQLVVIGIRMGVDDSEFFRTDFDQLGILGRRRHQKALFVVLRSRQIFEQYARDVCNAITLYILREPGTERDPRYLTLLTNALVLAPADPFLNALRVLLQPGRERVRDLAIGAVAGDIKAQQQFAFMLRACDANPSHYRLKYNHGIAEGGGMDVNDAAEQLAALKVLHAKIQPEVVSAFPFLDAENDFPAFRLTELKAASADFGFVTAIDNEPLAHRMVRYFEMTMLHQVLSGDVPTKLREDIAFMKVLERVARPDGITYVTHSIVTANASAADEAVVFDPQLESRATSEQQPVTLLVFIQGVARDARYVEFRLFPDWREMVSAERDGQGSRPMGAEVFADRNNYLYRPAVITLQCVYDERLRSKYFLKSVVVLRDGDAQNISGVPSAVVSGAFVVDTPHRVSVQDRSLIIDGRVLGPVGTNLATSERWMAAFRDLALEWELTLALAPEQEWQPTPAPPKRITSLNRIVLALESSGGEALFSSLLEVMAVFRPLKRGSVRREILHHPEIVMFDLEDDAKVALTERGRRYAAVVRKAGGAREPAT